MKRAVLIPVLLWMLILSLSANTVNNELKKALTNKEIKRIESAEKLIAKGDALLQDTKEIEAEIERLKNAEGRTQTGKINRYNKKIAEVKVKASLFYQDGYKRYIDVLDDHIKALEKSGNSEAVQARDDVRSLERKARKLYNKAENKPSAEKMVELIELAQSSQQKAIEIHSNCIINLSEAISNATVAIDKSVMLDTLSVIEAPIEEPLVAAVDSTTLQTEEMLSVTSAIESAPSLNTVMVAPITVATLPELPVDSTETMPVEAAFEPETEVIVEAPVVINTDVFFTIQIMADKQKASNDQLKNLYDGSKEVIEMHINDWFKYSVGRYQDLEEAKADMSRENIKGFIVAYNKNQRISVKEAVALINGES
jgi:hypothetical protein